MLQRGGVGTLASCLSRAARFRVIGVAPRLRTSPETPSPFRVPDQSCLGSPWAPAMWRSQDRRIEVDRSHERRKSRLGAQRIEDASRK